AQRPPAAVARMGHELTPARRREYCDSRAAELDVADKHRHDSAGDAAGGNRRRADLSGVSHDGVPDGSPACRDAARGNTAASSAAAADSVSARWCFPCRVPAAHDALTAETSSHHATNSTILVVGGPHGDRDELPDRAGDRLE